MNATIESVERVLECREVDFVYPGTNQPILKNLSLELGEPGLHALFGPSGVGKTSLARLLTGEYQPNGGSIHVAGFAKVLYAYNLERLPGWAAVGRHLELVTPAGNAPQKNELIKIFDIAGFLTQRFAQLSMGQQNRINLVRYLLQSLDLLIMDECLANVDEKTRGRILAALKELFPSTVFLYISHNVVEVAKYCRTIWVLRGPRKHPQTVRVEGCDYREQGTFDTAAHARTMLEIMNAA